MSALVGEFLVAQATVVTTAVVAGFAWLWRQGRHNDAELRSMLTEVREYMLTAKVSSAVEAVDLGHLKRHMPQLQQTVAVLASELENHLLWHERHDDYAGRRERRD